MKKTKALGIFWFFLAPFVGLLLISCNKQEGQPLSDFAQEIAMPADNLTEDEVTAQALSVYNVLFSENLRSAGTPEVVGVSYQTKELVHCNFGWNGSDNGYYLSKAFNTVNGPEMRSTEEGETYGQKYNYQYNHQIIKDIKRR